MTTKKAAKATKSKPAPKAATTKARKPAATKAMLRKPQIRILAALKKAGREMSRKEIAEKAPVDNAYCTEWIGSIDAKIRAKNDKACMSLLTLKYVRADEGQDADGKAITVYAITAAGVKALEAAKAK